MYLYSQESLIKPTFQGYKIFKIILNPLSTKLDQIIPGFLVINPMKGKFEISA